MFKAIRVGFRDGIDQPGDFSVGMTYGSQARQLAYDLASRIGQIIARLGWR